jgi:signal transduction histidine kinase
MNKQWREIGWRLLPGVVTALLLGVAIKFAVFTSLEEIAYRTLFRVRGERPWDDRLVLIAIDDESIRQIGRFPWPREQYATLLQELNQANPALVVVSVLWSEPSSDDAMLADAMLENGGVVLPQAWDARGEPLLPVPILQNAAIALGHILEQQDSDGMVRWILPEVAQQPALGVATIQAYQLVKEPVRLPPLTTTLWLNWPGSADSLPQYSFLDVVQGNVAPEVFENKIVLLGVTATGISPQPTPFDQNPAASDVYIHATVIHNLLQQDNLVPLGIGWKILILLVGGPGLSWVMASWSTRKQLIVVSGMCAGWGLLSLILFHANYLPPVTLALTLFGSTALAVALTERLRENALLQAQVDQLWLMHRKDLALQSLGDSAADLWIGDDTPGRSLPAMYRVRQLAALAELFARSQSSQAAIARHLAIGLVTADLDGQVWFCNPRAANWLDLRVGNNLKNRLVPDWLSAKDWQASLATLMAQGNRTTMEVEVPKSYLLQNQQDKQWNKEPPPAQWFALTLEPLVYRTAEEADPANICDGILLVLEDITLHKQIEVNLSRQIHDLSEATQIKDDFWSAVSHELRSPLSNIKMAAQILAMNTSPEFQREYLQLIDDECQRELDLISELLDLRRLEAGNHQPELDTFELEVWLHHIVHPFAARTRDRQQTLVLDIPPNLPTISTDRFSLERLLVELINNACKYTPAGHTITVTACCDASPNATTVELTVSNTGVEISDEKLTKIFDKFYRIPEYDHWHQGGTGLGLALVKRLAEYLGGSIEASSRNRVTCFTVRLPLIASPA